MRTIKCKMGLVKEMFPVFQRNSFLGGREAWEGQDYSENIWMKDRTQQGYPFPWTSK